MHSQDEFKYFPADTKDPIGKYIQPKVYPSVVVGEEPAKETMRKANVSVANTRSQDYEPTKTSGTTMRGGGAATKGKMSRGPMC
jgi:ribosomal protein L4